MFYGFLTILDEIETIWFLKTAATSGYYPQVNIPKDGSTSKSMK